MKHFTEVRGLPLYDFQSLCTASQETAITDILHSDQAVLKRKISKLRNQAASNINALVNNKHHIAGLVRDFKHLQAIRSDPKKCISYITANLCQFTQSGEYIYFFMEKF